MLHTSRWATLRGPPQDRESGSLSNRDQHLIHELWGASNPTARCPHVQHDADGCRCGAVADPVTSRMVCDNFSLQL
jgi:hypothetical protein